MKNRRLFKNLLGLSIIAAMGFFFSSCGDDDTPPAPTIKLYVEVDGFTANIAAKAENVTSWHWDYGDGTTSDSIGGHTHTYAEGGDYTITCTVRGDGGEATDTWDVNIATIEELLTGGSSKTWVLSKTAGNMDGVSYRVNSSFTLDMPTAGSDVLDIVGLEEEYDNEFTFNSDGSYSMDFGNGNVLAGWVYSSREMPDNIVKTTSYGIFSLKLTAPENASWSLHKNTDLTINAVYDINGNNKGGVEETVVFGSVNYLTFDGDGFIGMKDYKNHAIIRNISKEFLTVTIFWSSYYDDDNIGIYNLPSMMLTLTFIPK
jgi:PKD repeat protein